MSDKVNWYPGHMAKATRQIKEKLNLVDVVIELRDARLPESSANPQLQDLLADQAVITLLTKADLAEQSVTDRWLDYFDGNALVVSPETGQGLKNLKNKLNEYYQEVKAARQDKGLQSRKLRAMVVGLPNVGKSTLINKLAGGSKAKTGKRPGVTRGQQWVKVSSGVELLDTPGLLWPDIKDKEHGYKLAVCGMIRPEIIDYELLGCKLIEYLIDLNPEALEDRYNLVKIEGHSYDLLADLGRNRGCLMPGGRVDRERAARILLQEFQDGTLGPISLEEPPADNPAESPEEV